MRQNRMIMKKRYIFNRLQQIAVSKFGRIIVLTGARQTGKTTLARMCFPDYTYLSIEDPVTRKDYANMSSQQWRQLFPKAILDEVQKAPTLIESIKAVYDQWQEPHYVLLGSSQLLLLNKVRESLAGRCHIIELFPLTLPEMLSDTDSDKPIMDSTLQRLLTEGELPTLLPSLLLDSFHTVKIQTFRHLLNYGGYPAITDNELAEGERQQWLKDYVATYLERDVRDLTAMRDLEPYRKLQLYLAQQTACTYNASEIARRIGITTKTVAHYLEYLRLSYQTIILPAWEKNVNKRLTKAPKVHYLDIGVQRAVVQRSGALYGNEFESAIVAEIYKQAMQLPIAIKFYHLRTQDGREVDLLIETERGYYAFEIKMAEKVGRIDARHLQTLGSILDKPLLHSFVVSNDPHNTELAPGVTALHAISLLT